jgi:hypothetical protein
VWINIKDGLPPEYQPVLVTDGEKILVGEIGGWGWQASGVEGYEWEWEFEQSYARDPKIITHWANLPKPPDKHEIST